LIILLIGLVRASLFYSDNTDRAILSGVFTIIISFGVIGAYFFLQKKYLLIELDNDTQIFILKDNPNKKEFDKFIENLYLKRAKYYKKNYFFIDYDGEKKKQVSKMEWLKKEKIISKIEYDFMIEEINLNFKNN